ncbi:MAG: nucleoside hydrolase, partial [Thermoguttaceae bacterium]|nr:nucleoside hydrolase [Thermoguttaceae bacterium]
RFFDDFGGFALPVVERRAPRSAATILRDAVRSHPRETSILALGPLTNVARAFRRDPELPLLVDRLVVAGGGRSANGRTTSAEFNISCDPQAARVVFQAPCAKTFVPADATTELVFTFDDLTALDPRGAVVGEFLRRAFLAALRARRRSLGAEVVCLQEFAAYFALVEPRFFSTVDAESLGEIYGVASGSAAEFEREFDFDSDFALADLPPRRRRRDVEIVRKIDADAVRQKIVDGLRRIVDATRDRVPN